MHKKKLFMRLFIGLIVLVLLLSSPQWNLFAQDDPLPPIEDYVFRTSWGGEGRHILAPSDVVVSDGKVFIVNTEYHRISILNPDGSIFNEFGGFGQAGTSWGVGFPGFGEDYQPDSEEFLMEGKFWGPQGIVITADGGFIISDTWNRRMQKFDSQGNFEFIFGVHGDDNSMFSPSKIVVDENENIFVVGGFNRIYEYLSNGSFVKYIEIEDLYDDDNILEFEVNRLLDVALDQSGKIYVAASDDMDNHRVLIYSQNFLLLDYITLEPTSEFQFDRPKAILFDANNRLLIGSDHRLHVYGWDEVQEKWLQQFIFGEEGTDYGQFNFISGMTFDQVGNLYITESGNHRVQVFAPAENTFVFTTAYGTAEPAGGTFYNPEDIVKSEGYFFVTDTWHNRIQKFSEDGVFVEAWGSYGTGDGQFYWPTGIAVDEHGDLYVVDSWNNRVQKFDIDGNHIGNIDDISDSSKPMRVDLRGIAIDSLGNIYVVDNRDSQIHKFNSQMELIAVWEDEIESPSSIVIDGDDYVYVTSFLGVTKFSNLGEYQTKWQSEGLTFLSSPNGIAVDQHGDVYTMVRFHSLIQKFTNDGAFLGEFGEKGHGPGQFAYGGNLFIDDDGTLYVVDSFNHRINVISPTLPEPDPDSGLILNGGFTGAGGFAGVAPGSLFPSMTSSVFAQGRSGIVPGMNFWTYGGTLPIARSDFSNHADHSLQLGDDSPTGNVISDAWAYQSFYVRPDWVNPVLTFNYNVFTRDVINKSDFIVEIQDGAGVNHLDLVVRDGFIPNDPGEVPGGDTELGWKSIQFDLSPYSGQFIRLTFSVRNHSPNSAGIWAFVEAVAVREDITESSDYQIYLPLFVR